MPTFELQFPIDEIDAVSARFPSVDSDARLHEVGVAVRARGYYTREEFIEVCAWKTVRSRPKVARNTEAAVVQATGLAMSSDSEAEKMLALLGLDGVGVQARRRTGLRGPDDRDRRARV